MAHKQQMKHGPDVILVDPTGPKFDQTVSSCSLDRNTKGTQVSDSPTLRPIFRSSRESQNDGNKGTLPTLIDSPLEVHVDGSGNVQSRREGNGCGSTGTKTSPSSAENGSGHGSRAPTALAGWSPTSMTTTASISVGHSPGLMDTSQGSASKFASDTPSPQYQGDITFSSNSQPATPSPPRRLKRSSNSSHQQHDTNGMSFKPRSSLYNNVNQEGSIAEKENETDVVVMRRKQSARGRGRSGRDGNNILRSALENHFKDPSNKDLDDYVRELFHQLDYHHCGTISREDFDTLCDVLGIQTPPPSCKQLDVVDNSLLKATYRRSGLEWLSSYRQRPNSPIAPLRFDKLGDIKYNKNNHKKHIDRSLVGCVGCGGSGGVLCQKHQPKHLENRETQQPPNFLFTLGPRPFWELWPHKKKQKKRLTIDDFKKGLLEQWAKNHGISPSRVSQIFLPVPLLLSQPVRKTPTQQKQPMFPQTDLIQVVPSKHSNLKSHKNEHDNHEENIQTNGKNLRNGASSLPHSSNETKTRRIMRSMFRVTRRFHVLRHLRQRGDNHSGTSNSLDRNSKSRFSRMSFRRLTSRSKSRNVRISSPLQVTRETNANQENDRPNSRTYARTSTSAADLQSQGVDTVDDGVVYATICHENFVRTKKKSSKDNLTKQDQEEIVVRRRPPRRHRSQLDDESNSCSDTSFTHSSSEVNKHKRRVVFLEKQVLLQQEEIQNLREVIEDLRSSLQLSDAQNLALQVLLKKMSKAESSLLPTYTSNGYSLASSNKNTNEDSNSPISPINTKDYTNQYKLFSNGLAPNKISNGNNNRSDSSINFKFRSQMDESEKQLENLVKELKEMSQTMYPPSNYLLMQNQLGLNSNNNNTISTASSGSTFNGGGISYQDIDPLQDEITKTSKVLNGTKDELQATQQELKETASRLQQRESDLEENSVNLKNAYEALDKAQKDLLKMRLELEEAQTALESTKSELSETCQELLLTQTHLKSSDTQLKETEKRLSQISNNRRSLVLELKTTRELLSSSLNQVQDLELKSQTVPVLENRIQELEKCVNQNKRKLSPQTESQRKVSVGQMSATASGVSQSHISTNHSSHPLRPLSTLDSGMYTSSDDESDHEDSISQNPSETHPQSPSQRMKFTSFGKNLAIPEETLLEEDTVEEEICTTGINSSSSPHSVHFEEDESPKTVGIGGGLPPRPPSSNRNKDKSSRVGVGFEQQYSPVRSHTPSSSSGHHSGGSKLSVTSTPTPSASPLALPTGSVASPRTSERTATPNDDIIISSFASTSSPIKQNPNESTILRLRREVEALKNAFGASQKRWSDERNSLLEELLRKREDFGDISSDMQILEAERARLSLLEEKIKEVLVMLRALNSTNISPKTLGRLVLDAVERSVDPLSNEIQVFKFLNNLYNSAREYERMSTESQIHFALREVEAHSKTLAKIEEQTINFKKGEKKQIAKSLPQSDSPRTKPLSSSQPVTMELPRKENKPKETFL